MRVLVAFSGQLLRSNVRWLVDPARMLVAFSGGHEPCYRRSSFRERGRFGLVRGRGARGAICIHGAFYHLLSLA